MSFLSDLFLPGNVKHYRKLARASGEIRSHAGKQANIELNLLLQQQQRMMTFHQKLSDIGETQLAARLNISMNENSEFFKRVDDAVEESQAAHRQKSVAATDARGLSALCEYEAVVTTFFTDLKKQALERLNETNEVVVEAIQILRARGEL